MDSRKTDKYEFIDHRDNKRTVVGTVDLTKEEVEALNRLLCASSFRFWGMKKEDKHA